MKYMILLCIKEDWAFSSMVELHVLLFQEIDFLKYSLAKFPVARFLDWQLEYYESSLFAKRKRFPWLIALTHQNSRYWEQVIVLPQIVGLLLDHLSGGGICVHNFLSRWARDQNIRGLDPSDYFCLYSVALIPVERNKENH